MTSTIREPANEARDISPPRRKRPRFSFMEALGFIDEPVFAATSLSETPRAAISPAAPATEAAAATASASRTSRRGRHEQTLADLQPIDISRGLVARRVRWSMLAFVSAGMVAMALGALWIWQRPAALAEAAMRDVTAAAQTLQPELERLGALNDGLLEPDLDAAAISARALAVNDAGRALFDAAGAAPTSVGEQRGLAADVASTSLDASRALNTAVAYRSAVIPILVPPELETDPELIGLDDAVRGFGAWRSRFDQIRSALPTGTMSVVSDELQRLSGDLESIQGRYIDGLRADDPGAAALPLQELADRLGETESALAGSLADVQARVDRMIRDSLAGVGQIIGQSSRANPAIGVP